VAAWLPSIRLNILVLLQTVIASLIVHFEPLRTKVVSCFTAYS